MEGAVVAGVAVCAVEGAVGAEAVRLQTAREVEGAAVRKGQRGRCAPSGIAPTSESKQCSTLSS